MKNKIYSLVLEVLFLIALIVIKKVKSACLRLLNNKEKPRHIKHKAPK